MTSDTNLHDARSADPDTAWQADVRAGVRHVRDLDRLPLSSAERAAAQAAAANHKVRAPKAYLDLIDWNDPADPIRAQVIPSPQELEEAEGELDDPIADHDFSPVPRLTHRHADRVLLFPTYQCAVYCRFCFRKESLTSIGRGYTREALEPALAYIAKHPEIREVILTGGDPLSLPDKALAEIRARIEGIAHVRLLRLHTRVPVALPSRITPGLVAALQGRLMVTIVTHFNHAREITQATETACRTLRQAGFVLLNQSVLLKGVNDSVEALEELCRELMYRLGVKPYYLHHGDLARGMAHRRTTIAQGQALTEALRARLSGICNPVYVLDLPEGGGKVPIGPCHVEGRDGENWRLRGLDGEVRAYTEIVGE
ncbi:KamA family radical SAM protein [Mesorhizobium sp. M7A.F.Ca.US.006.04.2.1]|uniref:KamA family radical SAM protein n=2 Tax=Mesorhizobium TaxID=68287 RepID=UPI000FCAC027|nr:MULTISPECIES: KamA family radical SAM protein [unclassified Mesorhizobium]RUX71172.1 KamA family radical SAM protein [Mesorhizobium sp. M7A.F.Ca.US.005.03.1.1]RUY15587.1 KamA family radical SAM protein [Mesorhizobium sp. M7A.F.Ca.US.005.03.2.1]RUY25512.1 KamA family radical SAM protein [Mesorhizobium sp. M7A.F.Ca.US.001.04.2.1]RUY39941.1 KamA family radical SAM protein [Mesorhizobium sp. M7A.F.Ca.US.001.04.1.1]RVA03468.1 KamA family radical SAM protein [Mesorhizobium sp. M7A.F.Ca.US.001.02.